MPVNGVNNGGSSTDNKSKVKRREDESKKNTSVFNNDGKKDNGSKNVNANNENSKKANNDNSKKSGLFSLEDFKRGAINAAKHVKSVFGKIANKISNFMDSAGFNTKTIDKIIGDFGQGSSPNCSLMAAIGALRNRPDHKKIMDETIKDLGNGKYRVTFKGAPNKPVTVTKAEIMNAPSVRMHRGDGKYDLDVGLLEVAGRKVLGAPPYNPARPLALLTGKKVKRVSLQEAMKHKDKSVVAHFDSHAYFGAKNSKGEFKIRNPHYSWKDNKRGNRFVQAYVA